MRESETDPASRQPLVLVNSVIACNVHLSIEPRDTMALEMYDICTTIAGEQQAAGRKANMSSERCAAAG